MRTIKGGRMATGRKIRGVLGGVLVVFLGAVTGAVQAQQVAPPDNPEATEAISKIRSPFCPGLMLEICPTQLAEDLRDSIQAMAEAGLPADSLVELVVAQYGEEYRAYPKRSGAGLVAWVVPPVVLVLGLAIVVVVLRHMRDPDDGAGVDEGLSEAEEERIKEAMAALEADA